MKIGILTFHYSKNNYGAVLQAYASFTILRKLGHEPIMLNLKPQNKKSIISNLKLWLISRLNGNYKFENFRGEHLKVTKPLYTYKDCSEQNKYFDYFYAGSDQIWRPIMARERIYRYFLDFVEDNKVRISYAASFGTEFWEGKPDMIPLISNMLQKFDAISVREDTGVDICKNIFNVNATHVLDPTFLLEAEDYNTIIKQNHPSTSIKQKDYVAFYLLDNVTGQGAISKTIQKIYGLETKNIYGKNIRILKQQLFRFNTVSSWLKNIRQAKYIITDSYHCIIFSIIFKKQFLCLINEKKGASRIISLLNSLGLEKQISSIDDIDTTKINAPIDYSMVSKKLNQQKIKSMNYLKTALNK